MGTYEDLQAIIIRIHSVFCKRWRPCPGNLPWISKEEIWDTFTQEEKDRVGSFY